jgi:hypothetical protein
LPDFIAGIRRHFGGAKLVRVAVLPKGDRVHVVVPNDTCDTFTLGGSGPHRGLGLVLGRRGLFGMVMNPRTDIDGLRSILSFGSQARPAYPDEVVHRDGRAA